STRWPPYALPQFHRPAQRGESSTRSVAAGSGKLHSPGECRQTEDSQNADGRLEFGALVPIELIPPNIFKHIRQAVGSIACRVQILYPIVNQTMNYLRKYLAYCLTATVLSFISCEKPEEVGP